MRGCSIAIVLSLVLVCAPALAQGVSEARGKVVDKEDMPIKDAVVTFRLKSTGIEYTGNTSKKGRYFISGLFTAKEGELWQVAIESEGFLPIHIRVESRSVNRVLIGDVIETGLKPGKRPPEFPIRPLGYAVVDWKMAPAVEVEEEIAKADEARLAAAVAEAEKKAAANRDPWVEALTLASAGSLEESIEFFQEAVDDEPDDAERRETFAKILYRVDEYGKAATQARRAVELEPSRIESHMVLFNIADTKGDYQTARVQLAAAREVSPDDTRLLLREAYVAKRLDDNDGAISAYRKVTELDPENGEAWLELGNLHADAGNLDESAAAYAKVVEINPDGAHQTYYNLGASIVKRGNVSDEDHKRAADAFRKALDLKPDYARAAQELAIALLSLGDKPAARETLEAFVKVNPNSPEAPRMNALIKSMQ